MNDKNKEILFSIAALLLVCSAIGYLFQPLYAAYGMAFASAAIAVVRLSTPYKGTNIRLKRLHRRQIYAAILYVITSMLMFKQRNEWIICLTCAALFELYAGFVIPREEK